MIIKSTDGSNERMVLIGMIVDSVVCGKISDKWEKRLFRSKWANLISSWCATYYKKYNKAPRKQIESLYKSWERKSNDKETIKIVNKFLSGLSDEYVELKRDINSKYVLDRASEYFSEVKLEKLREDLESDLTANDISKAITRVSSFDEIQMGDSETDHMIQDLKAWDEIFTNEEPSLIKYPGQLGKFFGNQLGRDMFVAFAAPEKRGKCVPENTNVLLSTGEIKTIKEIVEQKIRTPILALNEKTQRFEPVKISRYWNNGIKKCFEVETKTGRTISTTRDHKYLTPMGWKCLEDLCVGDYIAVPKRLNVFGTIEMNPNEIEFLAFMLADGSCTTGSLHFTKTDPILIDIFCSCCDALDLKHKKGKNINTIIYKTINIRRKYPCALEKVSSKTKQIPKEIFLAPKFQVASFLRTFFSCDGYISKNGTEIELTLANEIMCKQISHLLIRFGIVHSFFFKKKGNQSGKMFDAWGILIRSQEYVNLFLQEIGFLSYKHRETKKNIAKKSFLDKFPVEVAKRFHNEAIQEVKERIGYVCYFKSAPSIREQLVKEKPIMRQSFTCLKEMDVYDKYMNSDILWDKIVGFRSVGEKQTYDIAIPKHHNFVADDCIIHNSFVLMDMAYRAVLQRRKVAFFEAGDMSKTQVKRRLAMRTCGRPFYKGSIEYPTAIKKLKDQKVHVYSETRTFSKNMTKVELRKKSRKISKSRIRSKDPYFKVRCYPNSTLHTHHIEEKLREWAREGWVADVVIIDYVDILDMSYPHIEGRDRIDKTWRELRKISQIFHCLVVTATQTNRLSYDASTITRKHSSEDKRKLGHVTAMYGINQTADEKVQGVMRFNCMELRDGAYSEGNCVFMAGCLAIGNIAVRSTM